MNPGIVSTVKSPIAFFAITIFICNAVFAICASNMKDRELFIRCMHLFLGIVFFFGSIVIWTPAYLYHPSEVQGLNLPYKPWVPTVAVFLGVILYMIYELLYCHWVKGKNWFKDKK